MKINKIKHGFSNLAQQTIKALPIDAGKEPLWKPDQNSIKVKDLRTAYGELEIIFGLNLEIEAGSIFGLFGPNGGGKSTLLKAIAGLLAPTSGEIFIGSSKIADAETTTPTEKLAQSGLCLIPEGKGVFPNLTVLENLKMQTTMGYNLSHITEITFQYFPQLKDKTSQLAGTLSGGEQQMLSLSRALATSPSILLLDELSMGLAPIIVSNLYEIVAQVAKQGTTIFIVEQSAPVVMNIVEKAGIMLNGVIKKIGDPQEINNELAEAYLGTDN